MLASHPYSFTRYFGPGQQPVGVDDIDMAKLCRNVLDVLDANKKPRKMWVGEVGWALNRKCPTLSDYSLQFAAAVGQSLISLRSVPEIERCLWFTAIGCNEGGHEYGVTRGGEDPIYAVPAACVYSTCARLLDHAKVVRKIDMGGNINAWRFDGNLENCSIVALYAKKGTLRVTAKTPVSAVVTNSFGRQIAQGSAISFDLSGMPIYISVPAKEAQALETAIAKATITMKNPVTIENAYLYSTTEMRVNLLNHINRPINAEIIAGPAGKNITVPPGELTVSLPVGITTSKPIDVVLKTPDSTQNRPVPVDLTPIPRVENIKVDGSLSAAAGLKPIVLTERSNVLPADPGIPWDGPNDLSATAWFGWNDRVLYFAAKVVDDVHVPPESQHSTRDRSRK
jgi:hypothetical protein